MAGGITLLAVMLLFLEPLVAIPLHGVVQLVSNSSRTWLHREHVDWSIVRRYALPLLPLGFVGLAITQRIPPDAAKAAIGAFVLVATWRPGWLLLGTKPGDQRPAQALPRARRGGRPAQHDDRRVGPG